MTTWAEARANISAVSEDEKEEIKLTAHLVATLIKQRQVLKMSQRNLSMQTGIQQAAIARLERGNVVPRVDTLAKIAASLGLKLQLVPQDQIKI